MKILLATSNLHKKEELSSIITDHQLLLPQEIGIDFDHKEIGTTYFANAYDKAHALFQLVQMPILADDSGLSVEALNGAPGIYSARFGQVDETLLSDSAKSELLLETLKDEKNRKAYFISNIVFFFSPYRFYSVQETLDGEIYHKLEGENGFGYDPIFWLPSHNKTVAQLESSEKNKLSHRGKAARKIIKLI